jgi:large subunit ribosomal protein L9
VILRSTVSGLGKRGEVVDVSDGYARNFLIPKGMAMRSHPGAEDQAASMRRAREERDLRERGAAEEVAPVLAPLTFKLTSRASGDRLFGSVTPTEIVEAVYNQTGHELDRRQIEIDEPIKTTGLHSVPARLHDDVTVFLQVDVSGA